MAADFNKPAVADNYSTGYTPAIVDNLVALAKALDPAVVTPANIPTNAVGWSSANSRWEKYNGTSWGVLSSSYAINISGTAANVTGTVAVGNGGTGATTFTAGGLLVGNGTSALGIATAAQIVAAIGSTAVTTASQLGGVVAASYAKVGRQTIWIPAGAMVSRLTNGPAAGFTETATNKVMLASLDFNQTTNQYAQFQVRMPKSWNKSTVTAVFTWTAASGSGNVIWGIRGVALRDDSLLDTAFGTPQYATADPLIATTDLHTTAETSACTIANSPVAEDWVVFEVFRDAASGSDTLTADARLLGVTLYYTTDGQNDA
jgi:hypothetical protein